MDPSLIMNIYELELRPLTPIIVLSGIEGVINIDVLIRDREVCVIDFEKLPLEVIEKIASLKDISKVTSILLGHVEKLPCRIIAINNVGKVAFNKTVKLPQEHIIPGSTLKGYIRTALLYHILISKHLSGDILRKLINLMVKNPQDVASDLEIYAFKRERLKKQRGYIDVLQNLYISDPLVKESIEYSLDWLNVFEIRSLTTRTPRPLAQLLGIVFVNGLLKYKIVVTGISPEIDAREPQASLLKDIISKLNELLNTDLVNVLKFFGCELLNYELEVVKNFEILKDYREFLEKLRTKYCIEAGNCVIGRLGFMTGHMTKTIDLYLKKNYPDIYQDVKNYMSTKYRKVWDEATIKLVGSLDRLRGLGWCEICTKKLK